MINQPLQNAISKLWDSVNKSSEMLSSARYENKALVSQIAQIMSDKDVILDELRRTRDEMNRLRGEVEQSTKKVEGNTKLVEDFRLLESRYGVVEREIGEKQNVITVLQNRNTELEQTIVTLQLSLNAKENLAKRADQLETENHTLSSKLGEMLEFEKNLEIMRRELARKNSDVNSHLNEVQRLKNERAEMESKLFEIPKQKEEITVLKLQVEQLISERDELLKTHEEAHEYSRLHKIQQESIDSYSQQILDLKRLNGQLENEKNEKDKYIEILQRKIDEQTMTQERLHLQLRSAREYEQQISEQLKSLDDYSAQLIEMRKTLTIRDEELLVSRTNEKELQQLVQKEQQAIWVLNERIGALSINQEKLLSENTEIKSNNEKVMLTLSELQDESQKLRYENSELLNQKSNFLEQNEVLQNKVSELENVFNITLTENEVLKSKANALTIEIESAYEKLKTEQNSLKLLREELNNSKEDNTLELQKLGDEIVGVKRELNEQIRTAAEFELLNRNLLSKISDMESNYSQTKEALTAATTDIENISEERETTLLEHKRIVEKINNDLESERETHNKAIKNLESSIVALEVSIKALNNEKEIAHNEIVSLQNRLEVMTNERDEYLGQISTIIGEKEEGFEQNQSRMVIMSDELQKMRSTGVEIKEENDEFRRQIDVLSKTLEERNAHLDLLREQLTSLSKDRSTDEMQIRQKEKMINELANKLNVASMKIAQFSSSHSETSVTDPTSSSNAWLRDENKNLHIEMQSLTEELIALRSDRDSVNAYNSTLTQEVKLLREQSDNRESKIFAMKGELMRLKNQMTITYEPENSLSAEKERSVPHERNDILASRIKQTVESLEKFL